MQTLTENAFPGLLPGNEAFPVDCRSPELPWLWGCTESAAHATPDHSSGDDCNLGHSSGSGGRGDLHEGGSTSWGCCSRVAGRRDDGLVEGSADLKPVCDD